MLAVSVPSLSTGLWRECLWTAEGAFVCKGEKALSVDMHVIEGQPGFPSQLLPRGMIHEIEEFWEAEDRLGNEPFEDSLSREVNSIPLKSDQSASLITEVRPVF